MTRSLGLAVLLAACGADPNPTADFVGTWTYGADSVLARACADTSLDLTTMPSGSFQLWWGAMADLIEVPPRGDSCPALAFDVTSTSATIRPGQSCTQSTMTDAGVVTSTIAYDTATYTLATDNQTITGSRAGTLVFSGHLGTTSCTFHGTSSGTRVDEQTSARTIRSL